MSPLEFTLAILLLLATPGPTNTLLSLSGAASGVRRSLRLMAGEIGGYLSVVVPVATLAAPMLRDNPEISIVLKLCAAAWILLMACRLWTTPANSLDSGRITVFQVFVTTLLNPKALIIALVIMPHRDLPALLPWIAGFTGLVLLAGSAWIFAGAAIGRTSIPSITPGLIRKVAAACLLFFSVGLAGTAVAAL